MLHAEQEATANETKSIHPQKTHIGNSLSSPRCTIDASYTANDLCSSKVSSAGEATVPPLRPLSFSSKMASAWEGCR